MGCLDGGSHRSSSWPPFSVWKWGHRWPRWRGRLKSTRMCFTAGGGSSAKGQTQGVVERKTTMPILSNLLCEAKGNRLTITATDLELGIRTGCEAKVKKEGSGTIRNTVPGAGRQRWDEGRLAQLEGKMGQQALEIDFLKGCFRRIDEQRKLQAVTGKTAVFTSRSRPKGTEPKP